MDVVKKIKNYTYNERHCIGEGSFGRVYEGKSQEGLKVAIKKVQQSMVSKDPYLRASLQTEINIMKKLNHPNIVKLYDVVITNNSIYLIMEYCAGGDLKRYCRNKKLSQDEAKIILKHICRAFQQLAQLGIIHRDLKPANILVHEGVFKICDFGFAKFFADTSRMTRTCVGTPIYMSPQVLCQKVYTEKTDVWSLGILFYELLFAKLPYYGATQDALYRNITQGPLIIPSCSSFSSSLLKGMLQIDENKRYSWNKIFQLLGLDAVVEQHVQEGGDYQFYNNVNNNIPTEIKRGPSNYQKQQSEPIKLNNYMEAPYNNYNNYQPYDDQNGKVKPQKRPINPLAYQNPAQYPPIEVRNVNAPIQNQNIPPSVQQRKDQAIGSEPKLVKHRSSSHQSSTQNPRFLYFVLIQLIVNPIKNSYSYSQLVSALYRRAIELYSRKIEKQREAGTLYGKVLSSQFDQLKSIQAEIPNFINADLQKSAQAVYRQSTENGNKPPVLAWVKKIMTKNHTYTK